MTAASTVVTVLGGRRWSLRRTLLTLLLGLTVALWASSAAIVYVEAEQESHELFDGSLAETANLLLSLVGNEIREHGYIKLPLQGHPNPERYLLFQVLDADGSLLYRNAGAQEAALSDALAAALATAPRARPADGYSWVTLAGERWRLYSLWDNERALQLVVAEPTTHREDISTRFFYKMLAFGTLLVVLAAAVIWLSVNRVFRVLQGSASEVAARTPNDLSDVKLDDVPSEALPLIQAINRLFGRVRRTMEYEQRFTADAAHELRTPLAAIKTNLQVLQRARSPAEREEFIAALGVSVDRATRLVDQLLTLARLDPQGDAGLTPMRPGDLARLVREESPGWRAACAQLGLTLELDIAAAPCAFDADSMRMLLRNLVDNAMRYTPAPGVIGVACGTEATPGAGQGGPRATCARTVLRVADSGPGIPPALQEQVFERFVRLAGSKQPGSGLGLSIVRSIADRHGSQVELGPGLRGAGLAVSVRFAAVPGIKDER